MVEYGLTCVRMLLYKQTRGFLKFTILTGNGFGRFFGSADGQGSVERIYSQEILELAASLVSGQRLTAPQASVRRTARICGSVIEVDMNLDGEMIVAFGQDVSACALGQASASILSAHIRGSSIGEIRELRQQVSDMLKEGGRPPQGKWSDYRYLQPVRDYPARHGSTLLALNAAVECLEKIKAARS